VAVRSLTLRETLRGFCLAAFALLGRELEGGEELPFAFEEHRSPGRPPLYEYRPLAGAFVDEHAAAIAALEDARIAIHELGALQQAAFFARAHAGLADTPAEPVLRSILLPLVVKTVERCGGLDWDDAVFERVYAELERSLFAERRAYAAVAPLLGVAAPAEVDLGGGLRVRPVEPGELAAHWPEAGGLLPQSFRREPGLVLEWQRPIGSDAIEPPDAPGELADAVTALRLATAGAIAAGPVVFERLDWRPYGIRPLLPVAATQPPGEPARLDSLRARIARDLVSRLGSVEADGELADALDRWELSLFEADRQRVESLRDVLERALGNGEGVFAAALRAAALLGGSAASRRELLDELRLLAAGASAAASAVGAVRRALVEVLLHGDRTALVASLDDTLVGLRPRPSTALAGHAASA
jgi:hypothetical protein